jgi:glutaminyl-peptide cyclotransferase
MTHETPTARRLAVVSVVIAAALTVAACDEDGADSRGTTGADDLFDADRAFDDLRAQVEFGPRPAGSPPNRRQTRFLARRLRQAGADGVRIQRPHRNVVATIPGRERGTVVVGAHHDTYDLEGLVGANDGASGVAVVLELARSLPRPLDGPSVRVALFDAEEARPGRDFATDGTRGSRQYLRNAERDRRRMGSPAIESIRAMVLFDLVGDCELELPREASSDAELYSAFEDAAREVDGHAAPFGGEVAAVADDHVPFLEAGIPAVDLIDFTYGGEPRPGPYWHTTEDTLDKVCAGSLDVVGEAAMRAIPRFP